MPCSACGSHHQSRGKFKPLTKKKATPPPPPPIVAKKTIAPPQKVFRPINAAQYKLYKERMKVVEAMNKNIEAAKKKRRYAHRFKRMNFASR